MQTLGRQGKYYKTLQIIIACLNSICYAYVHQMNLEFTVLEVNTKNKFSSTKYENFYRTYPKRCNCIMKYISGASDNLVLFRIYDLVVPVPRCNWRLIRVIMSSTVGKSILVLQKLIKTYNGSSRPHDMLFKVLYIHNFSFSFACWIIYQWYFFTQWLLGQLS